jgi:hypothetical protein
MASTLNELLELFLTLGVSHSALLTGVVHALGGEPQTIPVAPAKISIGKSLLLVGFTDGGLSVRWTDKGP